MKTIKQRFKTLEYQNRSGSTSYRVTGITRSGQRIRENYLNASEAKSRETQLEAEYHAAPGSGDRLLRTTRLNDDELRICEAALARLDQAMDLTTAVDHWLRTGKPASVESSPRLDEAVKQWETYLDAQVIGKHLRQRTADFRKNVIAKFQCALPNMRIIDVQPAHIEKWLDGMTCAPDTKNTYRKVAVALFAWCMESKRRWTANNPAFFVTIEGRKNYDEHEPVILSVKECDRLMRSAEKHDGGVMAPYFALCMFAGIRPEEVQRMTWEQINFEDREIRLRKDQTKTGTARTIEIDEPLMTWLLKYKGEDVIYWHDKMSLNIRRAAGLATKANPWPQDVLRHTAISHYFRKTGSYGLTAERHGNTEAIIKKHYAKRVSTKETEAFYAIRPTGTPANLVSLSKDKAA